MILAGGGGRVKEELIDGDAELADGLVARRVLAEELEAEGEAVRLQRLLVKFELNLGVPPGIGVAAEVVTSFLEALSPLSESKRWRRRPSFGSGGFCVISRVGKAILAKLG